MELTLKKEPLVYALSQVFKKKGENVLYEEKVVDATRISGKDIIDEFNKLMRSIDLEGKRLIITDPYLLICGQSEKILDKLVEIISSVAPAHVLAVTPQKDTCPYSKDCLERKLYDASKITFQQKNCNRFHDRFWITDEEKGFLAGTSINGLLGTSVYYMDLLEKEDVRAILDVLAKEKII